MLHPFTTAFAVVAAVGLMASPALAYIGPGAGLGAIGTLIALIGALLLAVVGFVWYPLKRLMRHRSAQGPDNDPSDDT